MICARHRVYSISFFITLVSSKKGQLDTKMHGLTKQCTVCNTMRTELSGASKTTPAQLRLSFPNKEISRTQASTALSLRSEKQSGMKKSSKLYLVTNPTYADDLLKSHSSSVMLLTNTDPENRKKILYSRN